jgi:hypothetical protein
MTVVVVTVLRRYCKVPHLPLAKVVSDYCEWPHYNALMMRRARHLLATVPQ